MITRTRSTITDVQHENKATKQKLTMLESFVNTEKTNTRADLTKLERTVTSMNRTYQGKYAFNSDKIENFRLIFSLNTQSMIYFTIFISVICIFYKRLCNEDSS